MCKYEGKWGAGAEAMEAWRTFSMFSSYGLKTHPEPFVKKAFAKRSRGN